ncbi:ParB/RepB/Spo0J family partition protein [Saccharothrix deserti]|uniref:ParB/RepB/Spo0J family partition protein n=1 Tax=Saccharothrix deserti TaxID=2593674 RepID=UPI001EE3A539|nr:ParB N-terminal domain-containing protein [Saccharothrix deserti]
MKVADSPRLQGENPEHTLVLAEIDEPLPPIIVHRGSMRVVDGVHRLRAAVLRGGETIEVQFFDGTEDDAFLAAVAANLRHGLPLNRADRTAAAQRILHTHPEWSDRMIASAAGLSPSTVGELRRRSTDRAGHSNGRVGRDGRVRPLDGARRRQLATEYLERNPDASLREVARAAGISPATASDVRARLRRGEEPAAPTGRSSPSPKEIRQSAARHDREAVVRRLKSDPAIRFTDAGKWLLRFLEVNVAAEKQQEQIAESVPQYWRSAIVEVVRECADSWLGFATELERRQDRAG